MPALKAVNLTKRRIDQLKPGETLWDTDPRGFCCRCQKKRKIFLLRFRTKGRQRWLTIGEYGAPWTVETARREAQRLLGEIRGGMDVENLRYGTNPKDPTMADLCSRFIEDYAKHHKKASSVYIDELNVRNHIIPLIGKLAIKDVARSDIERLKTDIADGKTATKPKPGDKQERFGPAAKGGRGAANRCLALLSKMLNLAESWGWRAEHTNPVRLVAKYPENECNRFLSDEELMRLATVLDDADIEEAVSPYATAALRLLILTGARLSEILTLKWDYVDDRGGFLQLPDSKTGTKVIFLSDQAMAVLRAIEPVEDNPFVIAGTVRGQHIVNLQKPWRRLRKKAGLEDVRIHDLRHSFASIAASNGASLPMIGQLLGHKDNATTQRYAHLTAKPVRDVNDQVGQVLQGFVPGSSGSPSNENTKAPESPQSD